jgi:hypothetical protein
MDTYVSLKIINAEPMSRIEYNHFKKWLLLSDVEAEGYLVDNSGYYWVPKKEFEKIYRKTGKLSFGLAIEAAKLGKKIARTEWNEEGTYVALVEGKDSPPHKWNPYFVITSVNGSLSTWVPSVNDCLADDWMIV